MRNSGTGAPSPVRAISVATAFSPLSSETVLLETTSVKVTGMIMLIVAEAGVPTS